MLESWLSALPLPTLLIIVLTAFLSGVLHGATGMAGGIVMTAILSSVLGIKQAVPIITCALIFSHFSRLLLYWRDTDWAVAKRVLLFGTPTLISGAVIFSILNPNIIAAVFVLFLLSSFPIKYWARKHQITTGPKLLATASVVWGLLAGNVVGPGLFLAPFLLGTGMNRLTFVGTLASITLIMNIVKLSVFGMTELLSSQLLALGALVGLISVPGNWLGRSLLTRLSDTHHRFIIDAITLMVIANFVYLAVK